MVEFVEGKAVLGVCLPYAIRSRFIFATAHLCHQANQTKLAGTWKDDMPLDDEIYFDVADKCGTPWRQYRKLKPALEKIANKAFAAATGDFRSKFNHRLSPCIEFGLTQFVTRIKGAGGRIVYGFGSTQTLPLASVVATLKDQLATMRKALTAFQALVEEQAIAIRAE